MSNTDGFTLGQPLEPDSEGRFQPFPFKQTPDLNDINEEELLPHGQGVDLANGIVPNSRYGGLFLDGDRLKAINHLVATFIDDEILLEPSSVDDVDHGHIQCEGVDVVFAEDDKDVFSIVSRAIDPRRHPWNPPALPALPELPGKVGRAGIFATKVYSTLNRPYYEILPGQPGERPDVIRGRIIRP